MGQLEVSFCFLVILLLRWNLYNIACSVMLCNTLNLIRLILIFHWCAQLRRHTNLSGNVYNSQTVFTFDSFSSFFCKIISLKVPLSINMHYITQYNASYRTLSSKKSRSKFTKSNYMMVRYHILPGGGNISNLA